MSRDEVHTHHRGDKEASECHLIRCNTIERAYETLTIDTTSSKKIKDLLYKVWSNTIRSDFPIIEGGEIVSIKNPIFEYTTEGSSIVTCDINFHTGDGKELAAFLKMEYANDQPFKLEFSDTKIGKVQTKGVSLCFEKPAISDSDLQDRIENLKELIKG